MSVRDRVREKTVKLREAPGPIWQALRDQVTSIGLSAARVAVAELFNDDVDMLFGLLATRDGRVFSFDVDTAGSPEVIRWDDITNIWQTQPWADRVQYALDMLESEG